MSQIENGDLDVNEVATRSRYPEGAALVVPHAARASYSGMTMQELTMAGESEPAKQSDDRHSGNADGAERQYSPVLSIMTITGTAALGSLATLTVQAITGPALERRKTWHARVDALNGLRQCLEDCMASAFYLQRKITIKNVPAESLDRIRADKRRSLENLETSTAKLCQLTMTAMWGGPKTHA